MEPALQTMDDLEEHEHIPVMLAEVLTWLAPHDGGTYVDATVGLGGHAGAILQRCAPTGRLVGIDRDPQALAIAQQRLAHYGERVTLVCGAHRNLAVLAHGAGVLQADGILLDLGVSSLQLDDAQRGFSFREAGPLDMRMGPDAPLTAEEVVNMWPEDDLAQAIFDYGEERHARRVARAICGRRPFHDTHELAEVVAAAVGYSGKIHPATRTFQALRITVNGELE